MQSKLNLSIFLLAAILGISSAWFDSWESRESDEFYYRYPSRGPGPCGSDTECGSFHCCLATPFGNQCLRKPYIGEICGGPYNCLGCQPGFQCVPLVAGTVVDKNTVTGYCQPTGTSGGSVNRHEGYPFEVPHRQAPQRPRTQATEAPQGQVPQEPDAFVLTNNVV